MYVLKVKSRRAGGIWFKKSIDFRPYASVKQIILHCSDSDRIDNTALDVHNWHLARHWARIGYHYFISSYGVVTEGRALDMVGSHCRGHNFDSIGICLNGKYNFELIQARALKDLISYDKSLFPGRKLVLRGHCEYNLNKTCPNFNLGYFLSFNELCLTPKAEQARIDERDKEKA